MGLLNKLLDDLEERQADLSGDRDQVLDGLSPVRDEDLRPQKRYRRRYLIISLVGICLVVALGYQFFEIRDGTMLADFQNPVDAQSPVEDRRNTDEPGVVTSTVDEKDSPSSEDSQVESDSNPVETTKAAEPAGDTPDVASASAMITDTTEVSSRASEPNESSSQSRNDTADMTSSMDSAERLVVDVQLKEMDESVEGVPLEPVSADKEKPATTREKPASEKSASDRKLASNEPKRDSTTFAETTSAEEESGEGSFSRVRVTAESLYERGLKLNEAGNKSGAIEQMTKALERDPGHIEARDRLAGYLMDQGKPRRAIEVLLEGLEIEPGQHDWAELAAHILVDGGELAAAVETLERTRPGVTEDPDYYAFLAALLQKLGHYEESAKHYRRVVQVRPHKGIWWMGLGISLERTEQFSDANAAYENALDDHSLSGELRNYINQRMTTVSRR